MADISHSFSGLPLEQSDTLVIWAHGWGHDRHDFDAFMQPFLARASHLAFDFPGFGASPMPPAVWETADYADAVAEWIAPLAKGKKIVWVGHSFGGRVGLQLAARHPKLVTGLFIVAGAGVRPKRGLWKTLCNKAQILAFKTAKLFVRLTGGDLEALRARFGSADYKRAGALRPIFVRVATEDLTQVAKAVACPTALVYGSLDREAPVDIGQRLEKLIKGAKLTVLDGQDHFSLLAGGSALVQKRLADFMKDL